MQCNLQDQFSWYQDHLFASAKNEKIQIVQQCERHTTDWEYLEGLQDFAKRNHPIRVWRPIFSRKIPRAVKLAVINVDWRRGSRGGRQRKRHPPRVRQDDSSSSWDTVRVSHLPVINLCRTIQRQRCITGSTAQVQRPCPSHEYFDRPRRE